MAKSTQVTAVEGGIQNKPVYRGNVQAIPITVASAAAGSHQVTTVLPQKAALVLADVTVASGTCSPRY